MKDFVLYEEAIALRELGFNETITFGKETALYDNGGGFVFYMNYGFMYSGLSDDYIQAPLYQQAFRWFREKHNLGGYPTHQSYDIYNGEECIIEEYPIESYEASELACLKRLIKIIKERDE